MKRLSLFAVVLFITASAQAESECVVHAEGKSAFSRLEKGLATMKNDGWYIVRYADCALSEGREKEAGRILAKATRLRGAELLKAGKTLAEFAYSHENVDSLRNFTPAEEYEAKKKEADTFFRVVGKDWTLYPGAAGPAEAKPAVPKKKTKKRR